MFQCGTQSKSHRLCSLLLYPFCVIPALPPMSGLQAETSHIFGCCLRVAKSDHHHAHHRCHHIITAFSSPPHHHHHHHPMHIIIVVIANIVTSSSGVVRETSEALASLSTMLGAASQRTTSEAVFCQGSGGKGAGPPLSGFS